MTRAPAVFVLVGASLAACARPSEPVADELLFAIPAWCAREGGRRPWTDWDRELRRAPSGEGICGVKAGGDDDGVCVRVSGGRIVEAKRRAGDETLAEPALASHEVGPWFETTVAQRPAYARISPRGFEIAQDGTWVRGPCFWQSAQ